MQLETALAKASLDVTARRDPQKLVHEMPLGDLKQLAPNFNFDQFFVPTPHSRLRQAQCRRS